MMQTILSPEPTIHQPLLSFPRMAEQRYETYTTEDHHVWSLLYARQLALLPGKASDTYLEAIPKVGFLPDKVPDFEEVSHRLAGQTGWRLVPVEGIIDGESFFRLLSERRFPATYWLRSLEQLDYLEEPDLFHDVFGHVPLLAEPAFAEFFHGYGQIGLKHLDSPLITELLSRMYWFTVEFGLIQEPEGLRIYGAGILSSSGETNYSLGTVPARVPFDLQTVLKTSFRKDTFQTQYFAIQQYEELYKALPELDRILDVVAAHERSFKSEGGEVADDATRCLAEACV